jgi:hypothetical protein
MAADPAVAAHDEISGPVPVPADRSGLDEGAVVAVDRLPSGREPSAARTIGPKATTMTSAADWPSGPGLTSGQYFGAAANFAGGSTQADEPLARLHWRHTDGWWGTDFFSVDVVTL